MDLRKFRCSRGLSYLRSFALICGFFLFIISGCCPPPKAAYYGPTLRMDEVVQIVNANNERIPSLWADTEFSAEVDDHGTTRSGGGTGTLNYRRPGDFLLRGDSIIGPVFEVGSNPSNYWLKLLLPQVNTAWFGSYANLGRPGVQPLPIQPDMLVEVLGVSTFNTNFLQEPIPMMTFNHEDDAYEFTWNARLANRWAAAKRISIDRETHVPTHVVLFDENGRTVLKADLSKPIGLELKDVPKDHWPQVATKYDLFFPESKIKLSFSLSDVALTKDNKGKVPNDHTFQIPEPDAWGVTKEGKVIDVDQRVGN